MVKLFTRRGYPIYFFDFIYKSKEIFSASVTQDVLRSWLLLKRNSLQEPDIAQVTNLVKYTYLNERENKATFDLSF